MLTPPRPAVEAVTPLVVVLVVGLVGVLAVNLVGRAREGRRSVRSHHRALDTLGHITTHPLAEQGRHVDVPSLPQRQAHVRLVGRDADPPALVPQPLTGGWRPTRARGAAPFRRPDPLPDHDGWDDAPRDDSRIDPPAAGEAVRVLVGDDDGPATPERAGGHPAAEVVPSADAPTGRTTPVAVGVAPEAAIVDADGADADGLDADGLDTDGAEPTVAAGPALRFDDTAAPPAPVVGAAATTVPLSPVSRPVADLRAIAALPHHQAHARSGRGHRRRPRRKAPVVAALIVLVLAVAAAAVVVLHHGSSAPSAARRVRATTVPTTTPTTTAPPPAPTVAAKLVSTSPGVSTYRLTGTALVTVKASAPCWIEVRRADAAGPLVAMATLAAGQTQTVTGPAWIRLGNPTGVTITVGATALSPPVTEGVPYDLQFS